MDHKTIEVTPELVRHVYDIISQRKSPSRIIDSHDGSEIGEVRKYEMSPDGTEIVQKGLILDSERYTIRKNQGYDFVSPELTINRDDKGRVLSVDLDDLALTRNPGMIPTMYTSEKFRFSAPVDSDPEETVKDAMGWKEPIGELANQIKGIESKLDKIGEHVMTGEDSTKPTNQSQTISLTPEQISEMIKNAVAEQVKTASTTPPETKVETAPVKTEDDAARDTLPPELLVKLNQMEATLAKYQKDSQAILEGSYNNIVNDLKKSGLENPEELVADSSLTLEQKIAILEGHKKIQAKNAGLTSSFKGDLSDEGSRQRKSNKVTVDDVMKANKWVSGDLREKLSKLKIFDEKGVFIQGD
jgi:hypothetical protein